MYPRIVQDCPLLPHRFGDALSGMVGTLCIKPLVFAVRLIQAAQVSPGQFLTVTQEGMQFWQYQEGELVRKREIHLDDSLLLVLPFRSQDHLTAALAGDSQPLTGAWVGRVVWMDQRGLQGRAIDLNIPQGQDRERTFSRETQPCCSNAIHPPAYADLSIGAVCAYQGCVHVYGACVNESQQDMTQAMYDFAAVAAAADPYQEGRKSANW